MNGEGKYDEGVWLEEEGCRSGVVAAVMLVAGTAVASLGWEIAFWPVMMSPFVKAAHMWWEKFVLRIGRTDVLAGIAQMLDRR